MISNKIQTFNLIHLIDSNNLNDIKNFISQFNYHQFDSSFLNPLVYSLQHNTHLEVIEFLIQYGWGVNDLSMSFPTLYYANSVEQMNLLESYGAKYDWTDSKGFNLFELKTFQATKNNYCFELFNHFIEKGLMINYSKLRPQILKIKDFPIEVIEHLEYLEKVAEKKHLESTFDCSIEIPIKKSSKI
jgi:hypothetical protein